LAGAGYDLFGSVLDRRISAHTLTILQRISAQKIAETPLNQPSPFWHSSCYSPVRLRFGALHKNN
jgi:hypothetical protein